MNEIYRSTAIYRGDIVDCRCLTLGFEYYDFSSKKVLQALDDTIRWMTEILGDAFISHKKVNGRSVSNKVVNNVIRDVFVRHGWLALGQDSFVISPIVYNQKTLRVQLNELQQTAKTAFTSIDFPEFWKYLFPHTKEAPEVLVHKMLQLFREDGKYSINHYPSPDVQALFMAIPYERQKGKFYGHFYIQMSAFCLDSLIKIMSERFAMFAVDLACKYRNVNARVQLQPVGLSHRSAHMRYFGANPRYDGSHTETVCAKKEWYQTYYIPGCEWSNIISPLAQVHLEDVGENDNSQIIVKKLNSGSLLVQSKNDIINYDYDSAQNIKKVLYPALYPGSCVFSLKTLFRTDMEKFMFDVFPRREWEVIPLFSNEVKIIGADLFFSHIGQDIPKTKCYSRSETKMRFG